MAPVVGVGSEETVTAGPFVVTRLRVHVMVTHLRVHVMVTRLRVHVMVTRLRVHVMVTRSRGRGFARNVRHSGLDGPDHVGHRHGLLVAGASQGPK